jgi:hypothetical protein
MRITEEDVDLFYEELTGHSADELLLEEKRRIIEKVDEDVSIPDSTLDQIDDIIRREIDNRGY